MDLKSRGGGRGRWAASSSNLVIEQVLNEKERRQSVRPVACMPGIHQGASSSPSARTARPRPAPPPPPFFSLSPLVARGSGHGSGLQPPTYARRARASSGPPSSFLRVDFLLSQSPLPSLSGLIHQKSLSRPGQRRSVGPRARARSALRRSKNEMRLKKQGAPLPSLALQTKRNGSINEHLSQPQILRAKYLSRLEQTNHTSLPTPTV